MILKLQHLLHATDLLWTSAYLGGLQCTILNTCLRYETHTRVKTIETFLFQPTNAQMYIISLVYITCPRYNLHISIHWLPYLLQIAYSAKKAHCLQKIWRRTDFIDYLFIVCLFIINCNWVDTRWQQYSTHLHTNSTQNTENGTYITIKRKRKMWEVRAVPRLCELYPGVCLTTDEKARKNLS
jgi:hypothetical protein